VAAFQPIDRDHAEKGSGDQEPWVGGPEHEAIRRHFIETRYQLLPYLYTLADEASRTGLPLVRPLFLEFPDAAPDHHPLDTDLAAASEFMLGADLLIAPAPYPEALDSYVVEFPSSVWYDYWTGDKISSPVSQATGTTDPASLHDAHPPLSISLNSKLAQLPVFVRAGSILPIAPIVQSTDLTPQGPLTLRVYVGDACSGELYQDDGKTYAYRQGAFLRMKFSCQQTADGMRLNIGPHEGSYPAWWKEMNVVIFGWTPQRGDVYVNSKQIPSHWSQQPGAFAFVAEDNGKGMVIDLK
jgi:alpha-glucosidase